MLCEFLCILNLCRDTTSEKLLFFYVCCKYDKKRIKNVVTIGDYAIP